MGISYSSTSSTLKIRFRYKGGNLETQWISYWKRGYLAKIRREGGTWNSTHAKGGNLALSLFVIALLVPNWKQALFGTLQKLLLSCTFLRRSRIVL